MNSEYFRSQFNKNKQSTKNLQDALKKDSRTSLKNDDSKSDSKRDSKTEGKSDGKKNTKTENLDVKPVIISSTNSNILFTNVY